MLTVNYAGIAHGRTNNFADNRKRESNIIAARTLFGSGGISYDSRGTHQIAQSQSGDFFDFSQGCGVLLDWGMMNPPLHLGSD